MSRRWSLPFGAAVQPDGKVRFRVWAPRASAVEVVLYGEDGERSYAMDRDRDGYLTTTLGDAGAGTVYRYRLDGADAYPDPASRRQPAGVHGPSEVIDPSTYRWEDAEWDGIALEDLVIYELHTGTFTPEGTFRSAIEHLPWLADLGVTAIELMPVANFPGERNWGYDGVNLYAPATSYGSPDDLRALVDRAHQLGLAVLLDVVYNHLGPEGNYLPAITGGAFFTDRHQTPWGDGINYDGPDSRPVRDLIINNALYWLQEYHLDGLRLDATHAIVDDSPTHILAEIADRVRELPGRPRILIAEDERNATEVLASRQKGGWGFDAVWADDLHHQLRRLAAGDAEGYFANYSGTVDDIVATLRSGWWRGEESDASHRFAPPRFVHCIQNHDQVGNRAFGERLNHQIDLSLYRAISTLLLLSPFTPLLWMGQEWGSSAPFRYFTHHPEPLGRLVTEGRRKEFSHFSAFADPETREAIPDPQAIDTFASSALDWSEVTEQPHAGIADLYGAMLEIRNTHSAMDLPSREAEDVVPGNHATLVLIRKGRDGSRVLVAVNFEGESRIDLASLGVGNEGWSYLVSSEERRFGGSGNWGRLEADGSFHLVGSVAVVLEG